MAPTKKKKDVDAAAWTPQVGDLVFAKIKGWPHWPARIEEKPEGQKATPGKFKVFFYGTYESAIVNKKDIIPYEEHKERLAKTASRNKSLLRALKEISETSDITCDPAIHSVTSETMVITSSHKEMELSPSELPSTATMLSDPNETNNVTSPPEVKDPPAEDDPEMSENTQHEETPVEEKKATKKTRKRKADPNPSSKKKSRKSDERDSQPQLVQKPQENNEKSSEKVVKEKKPRKKSTKSTSSKKKVSDSLDPLEDNGSNGLPLDSKELPVLEEKKKGRANHNKKDDQRQENDSEGNPQTDDFTSGEDKLKKSDENASNPNISPEKEGNPPATSSDDKIEKLKQKAAEKERLKQELKLEKLNKKRQERLEKLKSQPVTESLLKDIETEIVESLSVESQDIPRCLTALSKLDVLPVTQSSLCKYPSILQTIKKCRKFKLDEKVRNKSTYLYNKFKHMFTNGIEEGVLPKTDSLEHSDRTSSNTTSQEKNISTNIASSAVPTTGTDSEDNSSPLISPDQQSNSPAPTSSTTSKSTSVTANEKSAYNVPQSKNYYTPASLGQQESDNNQESQPSVASEDQQKPTRPPPPLRHLREFRKDKPFFASSKTVASDSSTTTSSLASDVVSAHGDEAPLS